MYAYSKQVGLVFQQTCTCSGLGWVRSVGSVSDLAKPAPYLICCHPNHGQVMHNFKSIEKLVLPVLLPFLCF